MSPMFHLKFLPAGAPDREGAIRGSTPRTGICSSGSFENAKRSEPSQDSDAVQLLLSMSSIVSKEIMSDSSVFDENHDSDDGGSCESSTASAPSPPRCDRFEWSSRARTVSIDSPPTVEFRSIICPPIRRSAPMLPPPRLGGPASVSPANTPESKGRRIRIASPRSRPNKASKKERRSDLPKRAPLQRASISLKECRAVALEVCAARGAPVTEIHRKKFSWKNYPELEAFLVANREEYLRHSALNYTVQQKEYNNRLTERLIELAAESGYVFDEVGFNFVTVRDRIRCYFKSYVQSAKKRGVIIGYAARKAGLFTEEELRASAGQHGQIITPDDI